MTREPLIGGGHLVAVHGASGLAVEGVPHARRGLIVRSSCEFADGSTRRVGEYRLTIRAIPGTDLWRVVRVLQ